VNDSINADPQIVINIMNYYVEAQNKDLKAENEGLREALMLTKEVNNEYNNH